MLRPAHLPNYYCVCAFSCYLLELWSVTECPVLVVESNRNAGAVANLAHHTSIVHFRVAVPLQAAGAAAGNVARRHGRRIRCPNTIGITVAVTVAGRRRTAELVMLLIRGGGWLRCRTARGCFRTAAVRSDRHIAGCRCAAFRQRIPVAAGCSDFLELFVKHKRCVSRVIIIEFLRLEKKSFARLNSQNTCSSMARNCQLQLARYKNGR